VFDITDAKQVERVVRLISEKAEGQKQTVSDERKQLRRLIEAIELFLLNDPTITSMRFPVGKTWFTGRPLYRSIIVSSGLIRWSAPNYYQIRVYYGKDSGDLGLGNSMIWINFDPTNPVCDVRGHRPMSSIPYPPKMRVEGWYEWVGLLAVSESVEEIMSVITEELALFSVARV